MCTTHADGTTRVYDTTATTKQHGSGGGGTRDLVSTYRFVLFIIYLIYSLCIEHLAVHRIICVQCGCQTMMICL
jgi:hypothetical protein